MSNQRIDQSLEGIRHLLSHLHGEVTHLETVYSEVLSVLRKLEDVANLDDLTGLMRRRSFFEKWNALIDECHQLEESCGVLLIDIDHFKSINDTYGHQTGDEVLRRVADLLKKYESPHCVVSRYGGEEFAIGLRGTEAELSGTAEMIRRGVEQLEGPVVGPDGTPSSTKQWRCTLSVGIASALRSGYDTPRLFKAADEALYKAKRKGRNRVA